MSGFTDSLDLSKRFPGYFNRNVFRFFILIMVLLAGIIAWENDFKFDNVYLHCEDYKGRCLNPFYICGSDPYHGSFEERLSQDSCQLNVPESICQQVPCDRKYLLGGETYGEEPSFMFKNFFLISIILVGMSFFVNHIVYRIKKRLQK